MRGEVQEWTLYRTFSEKCHFFNTQPLTKLKNLLSKLRFLFLDNQEKQNLTGYVLSVSPMKNAKKTNKQYFTADLETDSDIKNIVCFSPSKRRLFAEAANQHTGCEIRNVKVKSDDSTVFVSDYSTVQKKQLGFPRTNMYEFKSIADIINEVPLNSQVNAHGVVHVNDVRYVDVNNDEVPIREGYLSDHGGNIKLTLWREYTEIENGRTYEFLRLIKIKYGGQIVLQSTAQTAFNLSDEQIEELEAPEQFQPAILNNVGIIAVDVNETQSCGVCKAAAVPGEGQLYKCDNCSSVMLRTNLKKKTLKKITVDAASDRTQFNCHTNVITTAYAGRNIEEMDSDQISLLLLTSRYNISYDPTTGNVVTLMPLL